MIKIIQFQEKHIEDTAKLFITKYLAQRKKHRELPEKYADIDVIMSMHKKMVSNNPAVVALSNQRVVGYMSGYQNIQAYKGSSSGVYIPEWAHSSIEDEQKEKIYQKLYRHLAQSWIADRCYTHCLTYFADDLLLPKFLYSFGFGMLVIEGLRPIKELKVDQLSDITLREICIEDLPELKNLSKKLNIHLNSSPIFLNSLQSKDDLTAKFFAKGIKAFVAENDGQIISCIRAMIDQGPGCTIVQDVGTLGVNFGYTDPNFRGTGVATHLLNELLKWGLANEMKCCVVDFESQNIEGANFWLRYFKPICYSVIRKVDDRI